MFTILHTLQVCIFCEGTRFTRAKFKMGVEFARSKGLTELKYHLMPRTKGFAVLAHHLKAKGRKGNTTEKWKARKLSLVCELTLLGVSSSYPEMISSICGAVL